MPDETKAIEFWPCPYEAGCNVKKCKAKATTLARGVDSGGRHLAIRIVLSSCRADCRVREGEGSGDLEARNREAMNLRHFVALTLVSWYLIMPLSEWHISATCDTPSECEEETRTCPGKHRAQVAEKLRAVAGPRHRQSLERIFWKR